MWAWDGAAIGRIIKQERERRDQRVWTQRFLARKAGVSHAYVSHLESGLYKRPSREKVEKILSALDLDIRTLSTEQSPELGEPVVRYESTDPDIAAINANLLTMRDLSRPELQRVKVVVRAMLEDLQRQRREEEDAERHRRPPDES